MLLKSPRKIFKKQLKLEIHFFEVAEKMGGGGGGGGNVYENL